MKFLNNEFQKKGAESKGETEEFINSFSLENKCFITADCDIESYTDTKKYTQTTEHAVPSIIALYECINIQSECTNQSLPL